MIIIATPKLFSLFMMSSLILVFGNGIYGYFMVKSLEEAIVEVKDNKLIQKDKDGEVVAQIDLSRMYHVKIPYIGYLEAVYRIKQDRQKLHICSKTSNARHIVQDVLQLKGEWPPIAPWNFGW